MATIQLGGLATGLDTTALVNQLMAVERQPLTLLQTNKLKLQAVSAAFQDLNSRLVTLKGKADSLRDPATFFPRAVASSTESVATATAGPGTARGNLGAVQNRLASTVANLQVVSQKVSDAQSRIMDADFAAETAAMTKAQILQQAGIAILSQANSAPEAALSLLRR